MTERLLIGAHFSVAGGLAAMVETAVGLGANCAQVFTSSPQQWGGRKYTDEEVAAFRAACVAHDFGPVVSHDAYLVNPASLDDTLLERSRHAFAGEILRCGLLGIPLLVMHWGSAKGGTAAEAHPRLAETLNGLIPLADEQGVQIVLETTAGQGQYLGGTFEEYPRLFDHVPEHDRLGVCFDTCHTFVAGYDQRDADSYHATWEAFDRIVGIHRLKVIHVNDALKGLDSHTDRHTHIGQGEIGREGFRLLMTDPRLAHVPKILETPGAAEHHGENLRVLHELARAPRE
jgi:deoxyribonuclease IV